MFNNVSWQGYWSLMALLITTYYFALFLIFKKWGHSKISQEPSLINGDHVPETHLPIRAHRASPGTASTNALPQLSLLADELQAYFDAAPQGVDKLRLLDDVKKITKKYPGFPSEYYVSINNLIIFLAEQNCSLHIRSDEVVGVWST